MAVSLNLKGYAHATQLVGEKRIILDERGEWDVHQPTAEEQDRFIDEHGYDEYGRWFLGIDDEHGEETKSHYKFPYGDFDKLHKCAVLSAEVRAAQYNYDDIEAAAAHLHGMLIALQG